MGIKGNEEADRAAKEAIDMLGMTLIRLPYINYYLRTRNSEWQRELENSNSKLHHFKPSIKEWESAHNSCRQYEVKLSRLSIGHTRLTWIFDDKK